MRCAEALASNWLEMEEMSESQLSSLQERDPKFLAILLAKTVANASSNVKNWKTKHDTSNLQQQEQTKMLESRLRCQKRDLEQYKGWWLTELDVARKAKEERDKVYLDARNLRRELKAAKDELTTQRRKVDPLRGKVGPHGAIGQRVRFVLTPLRGKAGAGKVTSYDENTGKHKVRFDIGDTQAYNLRGTYASVGWADTGFAAVWTSDKSP